jgi:prevent-host-death family protein
MYKMTSKAPSAAPKPKQPNVRSRPPVVKHRASRGTGKSRNADIFTPCALTPDNVLPSVAASALRQFGSDVISRVAFKGEEVVVTRNGKPAAVIIPIAAYEIFVELEDASDLAIARRAEAEFNESGESAIPIAEARKRLGF